jgi:GTP-binding protein
MKFVDLASIHIHAGHGGVGCVSFRREKFVPKGGPNGGNGGRGGDVIIRANKDLATLLDFQYRRIYKAPRGEHGLGSRKTGRSGIDVVLEVPVGTIVRDTNAGEVVGDLLRHGDEIVAAKGGKGGRGNAEFATSTNQAPRQYEVGEEGEEREIELELKLLADAGLVGLPNAGKSTLISVISAAHPKIADYPFTTLVPNLGIVRIDVGKSFVVADIPGLIEGAHTGKGLGVQFLRHIERSKVLVILLDSTSEDIKADYTTLLTELRSYNKDLLKKRTLVAITKIDAIDGERLTKLKKLSFGNSRAFPISAATAKGIRELVRAMWKTVTAAREEE